MSPIVTVLLVVLLVIVGVLVIAAIWGVGIYNGLVALRNACKNAFAQVDVQLKRRYDLIPNLVETAKGYMAHERGTLEAVIAARAQAASALGAVNGALNIPVVQLPNRLGELSPNLPTVVYCAGGYRSSIAASLLKRSGFVDVSDVLGGFESIVLARE